MAIEKHMAFQVSADTEAEALNEALRLSRPDEWGSCSVITSGSRFWVEHDPGMLRTWETEIARFEGGRIVT